MLILMIARGSITVSLIMIFADSKIQAKKKSLIIM